MWPEFLPDGRHLLFTILPPDNRLVSEAQIAVLDLDDGSYKVVVRGGTHSHYVQSGHLVYGTEGTLRVVPFDLGRFEVAGTPTSAVEGVATSVDGLLNMAVAANGTLVYVLGSPGTGGMRSLVWVDEDGREEPIAAPPRPYIFPRLSPDETRIALDIGEQNRDIWIWDRARETLMRLTSHPGIDRGPTWARGGRRVVYTSQRAGLQSVFYIQNADGTSEPERLAPKAEVVSGQMYAALSPTNEP